MVSTLRFSIGAMAGLFGLLVLGSPSEAFGSGCTESMMLDFQRTYGDAGTSEFGAQAVETNDGGLLIVGAVGPPRFYDQQLLLLRLDAAGNLVWQRTYGEPGELGQGVDGVAATASSEGGFIVSRGVSREHPDIGLVANPWLAKVDASGDVLWQRSYLFDGHVTIQRVAPEIGGGYLIAGTAFFPSNWQDGQVYLLLVDEAGEPIWEHTYGSPNDSVVLTDVQSAADGNFLVLGQITATDGDLEVSLLTVDDQGTAQQERRYDPGLFAIGTAVIPHASGGCLIAGRTGDAAIGLDAFLFSTDVAGEIEWSQTYPNRGYGAGYYVAGLTQCLGGGYILAGTASFLNPDTSRSHGVFFLRTDGTGGSPDLHFYEQTKWVVPRGLLARRDHSLALVGLKEQEVGEHDIFLFKTVAPSPQLIRADSNGDSTVDISDAVNTLNYLFLGSGSVACADAADANDSGDVDISDAIFTLGFLFSGGVAAPPPPFPEPGADPTDDALTCERYVPTG